MTLREKFARSEGSKRQRKRYRVQLGLHIPIHPSPCHPLLGTAASSEHHQEDSRYHTLYLCDNARMSKNGNVNISAIYSMAWQDLELYHREDLPSNSRAQSYSLDQDSMGRLLLTANIMYGFILHTQWRGDQRLRQPEIEIHQPAIQVRGPDAPAPDIKKSNVPRTSKYRDPSAPYDSGRGYTHDVRSNTDLLASPRPAPTERTPLLHSPESQDRSREQYGKSPARVIWETAIHAKTVLVGWLASWRAFM